MLDVPNPEQSSAVEDVEHVEQDEQDDFSARTATAESLPLEQRADAFSALHDELRTRLETGGTARA
ncbi:hypothetical protein BIU92_06790 [Curtobacterium sp. MCBA15_003]|nr:hypothetical protein BIU92_06790 [Curtobacterium sp. MCBA15_003]OII29366.1 hypothetical protein BIU94_13205 [Curtobacterium sp. MMLR14_006]